MSYLRKAAVASLARSKAAGTFPSRLPSLVSGKEVIHSCVEIGAAVTQLALAGARDGITVLLDPLAIGAVSSIVINAPLSLRVCQGIGVERVNLKRALGVLRRALLNRKEFGDISVADHPCLHREQLVRWIDGSKERNDSFDWNRAIVYAALPSATEANVMNSKARRRSPTPADGRPAGGSPPSSLGQGLAHWPGRLVPFDPGAIGCLAG
jgi:hypothetical protein